MNIRSLQYFVHLCESRNFAKTAKAMHLSPSTLSRQIQKLENDIGQTLLVRDNRNVDLTSAGKNLLPSAKTIVAEWQLALNQHLENEQKLSGEIRLFCSVTASYSHLPELLSTFRLEHPNIEFKISTGDPAQAIDIILADEADIAISAIPDQIPSRLAFEAISDIPLSLIAPTGHWPFTESVNSSKWSDVPFILPESGSARERANTWLKEHKVKPNIYAQVAGHEAIVSMVALGCGIGIAPDVVINNSPVKEKIQRVKTTDIEPFKLGVCCKRSQLENPLVKALWQVAEKTYIFS